MEYRSIRIGQLSSHPVIAFAVQELRRYLKKMDPQLVVEICRCVSVSEELGEILWVGLDPMISYAVPAVEDPMLDDAISICIDGRSGFITGSNHRSALLGVYRFLRELGCMWVRPGEAGERIPRREITGLCVHVTEMPGCRHRGVCIEGSNTYENVLEMIDYLPKLGMNSYYIQFRTPAIFFNRWFRHKSNPYLDAEPSSLALIDAMAASLEDEIGRRGLLYHKTGHGWTCEPFGLGGSDWGAVDGSSVDDYARQVLAMLDGRRDLFGGVPLNTNLCYSNAEVRGTITDAVVQYCRDNPQIDILHLWLADEGNNHCECEACKEKTPSDWYVVLLNELDDKLTQAGIDTRVVFLTYYDLLWAPQTERLVNESRFILMFAPITRVYGKNYCDCLAFEGSLPPYERNQLTFPASLEENLAHLRAWQTQFHGDSFIFDYHLMWAHIADPGYEACARNLFEDMKQLRAIGLNGMMSCQVQRCFFPSGLPFYMMAKALWDPTADYETASAEYYKAAFGTDGLLVQTYLRRISGLFRLYTGVAHGHHVFDDPPFCINYSELRQILDEMLPVIERNAVAESDCSSNWQMLLYHREFLLILAKALEQMEQGCSEEAKKSAWELIDTVYRNELNVQKAFDCTNMYTVLSRRLGVRI